MNIIGRTKKYLETKISFVDYSRSKKNPKKINVGWCSFFPPSQNGVAAYNYYFINRLMKEKDIEIFAIPLDGRIDKKLFPGIKFAKINDKGLDAIVLFCLGLDNKRILEKTKTKAIVWQTVHESPLEDESERILFEQLKEAENLFLVTRWACREYKKKGKKAGYIPLGINIKKIQSGLKKQKEFTAIFVSRIHDFKGISAFLKSIPFVLKRHPETLFRLHSPLDIYSPHLNEINQEINNAKISYPKNFFVERRWVSYREIPEIYKYGSVLVFPSNSEGFGVPLVEAMASGIPCIVADKKPMNEIVVDRRTGFCIPIDKKSKFFGNCFSSPKKIAEKINFLIENKKEYKKTSRNAKKRALKEYNMDNCIRKLKKELTDLKRKRK